MKPLFLPVATMTVCLMLGACAGKGTTNSAANGASPPAAPAAGEASVSQSPLLGTWHFDSVEGRALSGDMNLVFAANGRTSGNLSCNRLMGGYTLTGAMLTFTPQGTTRMACNTDDADVIQASTALFDKGGPVVFGADGQTMTIAGRFRFSRVSEGAN